jgi:hypothetical protein
MVRPYVLCGTAILGPDRFRSSMHRSEWKGNSAPFTMTEFSEA